MIFSINLKMYLLKAYIHYLIILLHLDLEMLILIDLLYLMLMVIFMMNKSLYFIYLILLQFLMNLILKMFIVHLQNNIHKVIQK